MDTLKDEVRDTLLEIDVDFWYTIEGIKFDFGYFEREEETLFCVLEHPFPENLNRRRVKEIILRNDEPFSFIFGALMALGLDDLDIIDAVKR